MLGKLRSPRFKSRTRKIDFCPFPKAMKPSNKDRVKRDLSLIAIHETFRKCKSKSSLSLVRPILATQGHTQFHEVLHSSELLN